MATWRRIAIDLDPNEATRAPSLDQAFPSRDAARAQAKRRPTEHVSIHLCPHAAGEPASEWYSCSHDPRAQYEER